MVRGLDKVEQLLTLTMAAHYLTRQFRPPVRQRNVVYLYLASLHLRLQNK